MATHTAAFSDVRLGLGLWRSSASLPRSSWPAGGGQSVFVCGGEGAVEGDGGSGSEEFFGDRGLMKQLLSLKLSCPKLPEFTVERNAVIVSAVFYLGSAADAKSWTEGEKGSHSEPTSFKNLAISHLSPCQGTFHNSEQLFSCYLLSHLHCLPNFCTCFGLFLCFLFCSISHLSIQVSLPYCFND